MKKNKKKYVKPAVKKNQKMVNITFATGGTGTTMPGSVSISGTTIG